MNFKHVLVVGMCITYCRKSVLAPDKQFLFWDGLLDREVFFFKQLFCNNPISMIQLLPWCQYRKRYSRQGRQWHTSVYSRADGKAEAGVCEAPWNYHGRQCFLPGESPKERERKRVSSLDCCLGEACIEGSACLELLSE